METQIENITYLDKNESIVKFFNESDEVFNSRIELLRKLEKEEVPYKDALKLTKIYINVKYKKCKYNPQLYHAIKKFI
jgi:hypothetical protein